MTKSIGSNPSLVGILMVGCVFVGLALAPSLFVKTRYSFPEPVHPVSKSAPLPLDIKLRILRGQNLVKDLGIKTGKVSLRELLAKAARPVLVNFWATWCPPCLEEFPSLEFLNRQLSKNETKTPILVTVSVDENERDIAKFYRSLSFEPSMIVLHDIEGDIARAFGTVKFPETYALDLEGNIQHKWVGPQNWLSRDVMFEMASVH